MAALAVVGAMAGQGAVAQGDGPSKWVDPYIGVDWGGNTFVGSTVPFGMVKLGPDMETFDGRKSGFGYSSYGRIEGFSHTHLSGAQGKYGNILLQPVVGPVKPGDLASARDGEQARVGYYRAHLQRYDVTAELTSSRRVGFHRYTFPKTDDAHLTVDVEHCLSRGSGKGWEDQHFVGGEVHVVSDHEVAGFGRYTGGWNRGGEYRVYFDLITDKKATAERTWTATTLTEAKNATVSTETPLGAVLDFSTRDGEVVQAKVGISYVSVDQARQNVQKEVPGWDFAAVQRATAAAWDKQLSVLKMGPATPDAQRRMLTTAIYHTMLMPVDRTGENPGWQSGEPYYDDYYATWDTFRSSGPWLTLVAPDRQRDLLRSLIDIYRHDGYMPDARSGNVNGRTQGGSNANVVVADAWVKGLAGIDYMTALQAMIHDAEVPPTDKQKEGRGGLQDYNSKGYVTLADERSGSRTMEYANDDFAIATVACGLGQKDVAAKYAARSKNFENLWDLSLKEEGFTGFLRPKNPDGTWGPPNTKVRGTWPDFFYEGDEWTYSLYAPHDVREIIRLAGGSQKFNDRLDWTFRRGHFDVTNEPGFLLPVLYDWSGRPDKSADIVQLLLEKYFTADRSGIPGNDDSGAMSSWLLFQSIGFYPVAGQDVYVFGTPALADVTLDVAPGKQLHIVSKGFDPSGEVHYIQSATLNGEPLNRAWFRHSEIVNGGTLELVMGTAPSDWGKTDPPPSMSDPGPGFCERVPRH